MRHECKLTTGDPQESSTWRSDVRSAMCATSQLPGRVPLMWMMALHLHVNQKSDYDDDKCIHEVSKSDIFTYRICKQ